MLPAQFSSLLLLITTPSIHTGDAVNHSITGVDRTNGSDMYRYLYSQHPQTPPDHQLEHFWRALHLVLATDYSTSIPESSSRVKRSRRSSDLAGSAPSTGATTGTTNDIYNNSTRRTARSPYGRGNYEEELQEIPFVGVFGVTFEVLRFDVPFTGINIPILNYDSRQYVRVGY